MTGGGRKPRVGLIVGSLGGQGGIFGSARRHVRLLADHLEVIPISLEDSGRETDWIGRLEQADVNGDRAWRICSADLRTDRMLLPEMGTAFMNSDMRQRSYVDLLTSLARSESLDALHVFGAFEQRPLVAAYAAVRTGLPLIISFRGADLEIRIFGRELPHLLLAMERAALCVVNSRANLELAQGLLHPGCPLEMVPNHVDPGEFDPPRAPDLAAERPLIGCVGEFRRAMGLDTLLRAFERLGSRRKAGLLLVGAFRRTELGYYSAFIQELSQSRRIVRTGRVPHSQVLGYLSACDLAAFPSISDACPNKVLEAMLAERPIVAGAVGGIPDLITHGEHGLLVDPRDHQALAAALEQLIDDPALAARLAENAARRAREVFTPAAAREGWLAAYRRVLNC